MDNDPSTRNDLPPDELVAVRELGVGLLLSPRTDKVDEAATGRYLRIDTEDMPTDSTLARLGIGTLQLRYAQVDNETGWPTGSEMMMIGVRYHQVSEGAIVGDKAFFMTSAPDDNAPSVAVTFVHDDEHHMFPPTREDILELRSILMAAHEVV
ncbi:MAG: hypothetical protein WAS27_04655 [Candidatus Saccharimonadales bacterium]